MSKVLWWVWGFPIGARAKRSHFVGFRMQIGTQRWWRVSDRKEEGKVTNEIGRAHV